ncbi:hypothetical protein AWW70_21380 [Bacillus mycoides]|uniref:Lipoprotein n=1 Tax=Bacillus mycoides TaxID=1405 RepID=A0A109G0D2_BACMY|nr:hypothetical protein [Bacillus mycoides]KWU57729.1 hypothetical protein AWW70_21380 [Bacillus mycoides]
MKNILILLICLFIIGGCSYQNNELKWFDNLDAAITYGMKKESIQKEDILGKVEKNGEIFIVYKKKLKEGLGVGVSSISKENNKFSWYRSNPFVLVKNKHVETYPTKISFDIVTQSNKTFIVYVGVSNKEIIYIDTLTKKKVIPQTDKNTGIYFYIEFKELI